MGAPCRFQQRRTKGWRKPVGGVCCSRPSRWSNPFTVAAAMEAGQAATREQAQQVCVDAFRSWLEGKWQWDFTGGRARRERLLADIGQLRGHDLGCYCGLDQPCHVDVVLELANA
jgi:hypothetical protein